MNNILSKLIFLLSFCIVGSVFSDNNLQLDNKTINNINKDAKAIIQKHESVRKAINQYLVDKKIKKGFNKKNNKYIATAIVPVGFEINDSQFNDALNVAYENAYLKAQTSLLMDIYGRTITQKASSVFRTKDPRAQEKFIAELESEKNNKNKINTVMSKLKKLVEVKLDNALKEEGVNPDKIKTLDIKKKQNLFKKIFIKNVISGFNFKSLSGAVPIQTFIGPDKRGKIEFGLIMMKSDVTERIAMDMKNKRFARDIKTRGVEAKKLLPLKEKDYLKEFGVRIFFDEEGLPSLISYGQYCVGNIKADDADMISEDKSIGIESSKLIAKSQIAEFFKTTASVNKTNSIRSKKIKKLENEIDKTTNEEVVVEKTFNDIVKEYRSKVKAKSEMDDIGTQVIYDWEYENEDGDIFVGVVEKWSYKQLASAKAIKNGKNINYKKGSEKIKKNKKEFNNIKKSKDVIDVNDF